MRLLWHFHMLLQNQVSIRHPPPPPPPQCYLGICQVHAYAFSLLLKAPPPYLRCINSIRAKILCSTGRNKLLLEKYPFTEDLWNTNAVPPTPGGGGGGGRHVIKKRFSPQNRRTGAASVYSFKEIERWYFYRHLALKDCIRSGIQHVTSEPGEHAL